MSTKGNRTKDIYQEIKGFFSFLSSVVAVMTFIGFALHHVFNLSISQSIITSVIGVVVPLLAYLLISKFRNWIKNNKRIIYRLLCSFIFLSIGFLIRWYFEKPIIFDCQEINSHIQKGDTLKLEGIETDFIPVLEKVEDTIRPIIELNTLDNDRNDSLELKPVKPVVETSPDTRTLIGDATDTYKQKLQKINLEYQKYHYALVGYIDTLNRSCIDCFYVTSDGTVVRKRKGYNKITKKTTFCGFSKYQFQQVVHCFE